jgi:putative ubiquitin-RnfH superfamily antitoxin RatB of RatAB toxin-antitoxin module
MNSAVKQCATMAELLQIEVVFGGVDVVLRKSVLLETGATVGDAVRASGIADDLAAKGIDCSRLGVFGRVAGPATPLRHGDRVEIYRPLKIDPKEARRRRAGK